MRHWRFNKTTNVVNHIHQRRFAKSVLAEKSQPLGAVDRILREFIAQAEGYSRWNWRTLR